MHIEHLLKEFCHESLYLRNLSPQTVKRYKEKITFFYQYSEISYPREITKHHIRDFFLHGRSVRDWKPSTFRTYYMSLLVFFRWCIKHNHMTEDVLEDIHLPKLPKALPKSLDKKEAILLLEIIFNLSYETEFQRYRNHAIFAMFIYTGLRRSELLNLKISDVDIENQTVFVKQGKGNKDRNVPMNYNLVQILNRYLYKRTELKKSCSAFFTSSKKNIGFTEHGLKHLVKCIRKETDISFNIHKLRHTFATCMYEGGCDIYSLSKMMGHSDIRTTMIYMWASAGHLQSQIQKHPMGSLSHF